MHGFGDYASRYGYLAQHYSKLGYDFVGLDSAGFGRSEGDRGIVYSEERYLEDYLNHIDMVEKNYGGPNVPKFILGYSLGGQMSAKVANNTSVNLNGVAFLSPYFGLRMRWQEKLYTRMLGPAKKYLVKDPKKRFPIP